MAADLATSDLATLAGGSLAGDDYDHIIDRSDPAYSPLGTDKQISVLGRLYGTGKLLKTVHASTVPGVALNANPAANTGTDNTAALQAVLDAGPVRLVIDGPCLVDTLYVGGGSTVEGAACTPEFVLFKKGPPNSGRPVLRNKTAVAGPTAPTDRRVTIRNLYIDANGRNYGSGSTADGSRRTLPGQSPAVADPANAAFYRMIANDDGYTVPAVGFYGVRWLVLDNVEVYDPPAYGFHLANCCDFIVLNCRKYRSDASQTSDSILQLQGHCRRWVVLGLSGTALDDGLALNANDGNDAAPGTFLTTYEPGTVAAGPITDGVARSLRFTDNAGSGVFQVARFLSATQAAYIKNILIDDVTATIGDAVRGPGYAGFLFDTFGLAGDGTKGLVDGVRIRNVTVDGNATGAGIGFASVHLDRCNVRRLEVDTYRYRGYAISGDGLATPPVVYTTANAVVGALVLRNVTSEAVLPDTPAITLAGTHDSVEIDGLEYDLSAGGDPQPAFRDRPAVLVTGSVTHLLAVRGGRVVGLSNVLKMTGVAPGSLLAGGFSLAGSKGGGAVVGDTALPRLARYGADADHLGDVPAGSVVKDDGAGWYATLFLRDLFIDTEGHALAGHVSNNGVGWQADPVGANLLKLTGGTGTKGGWVYLAGGNSLNPIDAAGRPGTGNFEAEWDVVRRSVAANANDWMGVMLFHEGTANDFYQVVWEKTQIALIHLNGIGSPIAVTTTIPAVGVPWRLRAAVTSAGTVRTVKFSKSTDGGRTWAALMADGVFTTAISPIITPYGQNGSGSAGWTPTTGHQIGGLVVRSR